MLLYEGKNYARVSDVLRQFTDFSAIPPEVLAEKALLGTEVHQIIADHIGGQRTLSFGRSHGYYRSFLAWAEALNPKFVISERRFYCSQKMLTGAIDALISIEGAEKPILIDFKTSATESPTWPMQAQLYRYLLEANFVEIAEYAFFIKLDKLGKNPKVFTYQNDRNLHAKCMIAIEDFWKIQENSGQNSGN
jgi:hypothetical protein